MGHDSAGRRTLIADTVIAVLASSGARGLTHRAVDAAAGLPAGSASYYCRTREALLTAAAVRLADLDLAAAGPLAPPPTREALVQALAGLVHAQSGEFRDRTVARYQLSLEADRIPAVRDALAAMAERFTAAAAELLAHFGASDARRDARALIAVCAGLVFESTVGGQRPYTARETGELLGDLLAARLG
ncbi:MAG TPA: TetR/AcrR family transcriptional regulator [Trebonia sp.]|jgi:AcrR family transcriptional regulator|nr:TetR/AcrR family transcriptional regulator [Trebonia sp.]